VTLTRKSLAMLGVAGVLAGLNAFDLGEAVAEGEPLPTLPAVSADAATKITIGDQINMLTLQRDGSDWRLVAPLDYPADDKLVKEFLKQVGGGITMDVKLDDGNLEAYGVDDQHALRADVWTGGTEPALTFFVGKTAGPGASFVRLPGSETVYRADVGTRARYERPAGEWRERSILAMEREDVSAMTVERGSEILRFRRGPPTTVEGEEVPGAFTLDGAGFPVDGDSVELMVRALVRARAGELHNEGYDGGFEDPVATVALTVRDGSVARVVIGRRSDEKSTLLRVSGRPEVFRASGQVFTAFTQPVEALRDRTMSRFDRGAVTTMSWSEGGMVVSMDWNPATAQWLVTQPANVDADQRAAIEAVSTLASLRARSVATDGLFVPSGAGAKLRLADGSTWELILGQAEADGAVRARVAGRGDIFVLDPRTLAVLRAGFGRG